MSLEKSKSVLEKAIKQAFLDSKSASESGSSNPDFIIDSLARDIASAVHTYVLSANVDLQTIVSTADLNSASTNVEVKHAGFGKLR